MAQFNAILEGGLNQALSRRLDMQGGQPAPVLAPEIIPTLQLPVAPEELWYSAGWRRWISTVEQAAVAGEFTRFQINNVAGSGVLIVVEAIGMHHAAGSAVPFRGAKIPDGTALLTNDNHQDASYLDGHQSGGDTAQLWLSTDTNAVAVSSQGFVITAGVDETAWAPSVPLVLLPGNVWRFGTGTVQVHAVMTVRYRARRIMTNELMG